VNARPPRPLGLSGPAEAARGYALSMTLVGLRLQELEMGEATAKEHRQATLRSLRQAFSA